VNNEAKRAAIYVRVSQNREGDEAKPQRQIDRCRMLAEVRGYEVSQHIYTDDDVSAYQGKKERPEYKQLLQDIEDGEVDVVLTYNTDRMLRTVREMVEFIAISRSRAEAGGEWVNIDATQSGSLDLATPGGRMVATILASVAQHEGELKSERHKTRNVLAAQQGKSLGGPTPFGWQTPAQTEALRSGIKAYLAGESLSTIARDWNERGLPTTFKNPWDHNSVRKVLIRPRNAGLQEHRGKTVEGVKLPTEAVCTEEEWRRAVALAESGKVGHRKPEHLLTNLIRCSNGHKLTSGIRTSNVKGAHYKYDIYRCNEAGCRVAINRDLINGHVRSLVRHRLISGSMTTLAPATRDLEKAVTLREELGRLRGDFADNEADLRKGLMSRDGFRKAQAEVQARAETAQAKLDKIEADNAFAAMLSASVKNMSLSDAAEVGKRFDALPLDQRRLIVSTLFPTITVQKIGKNNRLPVEQRVTALTPDGRQYVISEADEYEAI